LNIQIKEEIMSIYEEIADAVVKGQADEVKDLIQKGLSKEISAEDLLNNGLVTGMNVVSVKFKNNEFFIPEVLVSARAMTSGLDILKPLLAEANVKAKGTVVMGTVKGDLHDIGKNIVGMMLQGAGFEIIDLGADVPKEKFVEQAQQQGVNIVGMSALLTTTMIYMKEIIQALKAAGLREKVKVIVGGAPVTQAYADQIEADGYAPDAASAVDLTKELIG
jgi:5-methyltetrahydrofolate--homocysteine methyltransferase